MTSVTEPVRISATYQMMGDHPGRVWAGIVFGHAIREGLITEYAVEKVRAGAWGIEHVTFAVETDRVSTDIEEATNFLNELIGDSDVFVHSVTPCLSPHQRPTSCHVCGGEEHEPTDHTFWSVADARAEAQEHDRHVVLDRTPESRYVEEHRPY